MKLRLAGAATFVLCNVVFVAGTVALDAPSAALLLAAPVSVTAAALLLTAGVIVRDRRRP